jgi:hypothetical protein
MSKRLERSFRWPAASVKFCETKFCDRSAAVGKRPQKKSCQYPEKTEENTANVLFVPRRAKMASIAATTASA